jgi:hypothetical protein
MEEKGLIPACFCNKSRVFVVSGAVFLFPDP